jgi:hypothetical protein
VNFSTGQTGDQSLCKGPYLAPLVGHTNDIKVLICDTSRKGLLDSTSMVSSISESFIHL